MPHRRYPRFISFVAPVLLAFAFVTVALGVPIKADLPNLDKRTAKAAPTKAAQRLTMESIRTKVNDVKISTDKLLAAPTFVGSTREFLTGKNGSGGAVSEAIASSIAADDPHRPAKAFLKEHTALFGFGPEALDAAKVTKDYLTKAGNFRTAIWEQHIDDIAVFEGLFKAHWMADGRLINVSSRFVGDLAQASAKVVNRKALIASPPISAKQAIVLAAANIGDTLTAGVIAESGQPKGNERRQHFRGGKVLNEVQTFLTWLPLDDSTVQLCWQVVLVSRARGEMFSVLVDAQTGEVLLRQNLTDYLSSAQYNVFTGDSPRPFSPGWSTPNAGQPPIVSRALVNLAAISTIASPNGWINDGDNITSGNNVDAHLDVNNDDVADSDSRPVGSPFRVFNFPLDLAQQPNAYTNAAVVNLFYWNNWMHDQLYGYGFDELAGNFQVENFGRGGQSGDPVQADAQDASVGDGGGFQNPAPNGPRYNNANFQTPFDGSSGRMQMYLFLNGNSVPKRDGDLDSQVICHEYTHGMSGRLVGGGSLIRSVQTKGLGEGWSDFVALSLLSKPGDDANGVYPFGSYVSYNLKGSNFVQNYYFGIRRYPYCTDMTKNPLTFKDIDPAQIGAHAGVPKNPDFGTFLPTIQVKCTKWAKSGARCCGIVARR